jgi:competence protein ComEC
MLWAALAYSLGILAGIYLWRPTLWWAIAVAAFVLAAAYFTLRRSRFSWVLALGAIFFAGALHIRLHDASSHFDTSIQPFANGQELRITAHVTRDGRLQPGGFGEVRQSVDVETEDIEIEDVKAEDAETQGAKSEKAPKPVVHSGIRLSIYSRQTDDTTLAENYSPQAPATMPVFHFGDRIRFLVKLKLPRNFRNPGAFDYQGYLADHGIAALGAAKIENVELLPGFAGSRIASWRSRLHRGVIAKVRELWAPREAALSMPWSLAKRLSSIATLGQTFNAQEPTTSWLSQG